MTTGLDYPRIGSSSDEVVVSLNTKALDRFFLRVLWAFYYDDDFMPISMTIDIKSNASHLSSSDVMKVVLYYPIEQYLQELIMTIVGNLDIDFCLKKHQSLPAF